jgi:putative drug exporter of the RND superfamily
MMSKHRPSGSHHHHHWFRNAWNRLMLWELEHPFLSIAIIAIFAMAMVWQATKLPSRLRGGLVSLPGSESEQVLHTVENEFSKAIAFPTILVQEGLGSVDQLEETWDRALQTLRQLDGVKDVIDMHLGRRIVAEIKINTHSFHEAREMLSAMHERGLPEACTLLEAPRVSKEGRLSLAIETDVRSFKEGEARRKVLEESIGQMNLPPGSTVTLKVMRHPRRNFAMVEADVTSYQEAEVMTARLKSQLDEANLPMGKRVRVTGLPALFHDLNAEATSALQKAELIGIPICFLLLILVFGSPMAALLPIIVALIAVATGSAIMTKVGKIIEISMFVPSVLSMIGLGVGVDYMLILISRFRECLAKHSEVNEAIMESMHLAAPTLMGSGFTVAIGFSALVFTPIVMFKAMGFAGIVVILSALICIFLISPPLFKLAHRFISPRTVQPKRNSFWRRWTHFVVEHPILCLAAGLLTMVLIAAPARAIKTTSLNPDDLPRKLESRKGYDLCRNGFGAGWLMPAVIVVEKPEGIPNEVYLKKEEDFIRNLRGMKSTFDAVGASDLSEASGRGFDIEIPANFFVSKSGKFNLVLAMYNGNPMSMEGREWIEQLRSLVRGQWKAEEGFQCNVGGVVASTLDVDVQVKKYLVHTAVFCLATTFVCLAFFYRSILIPLQAILMNLLSVSAAYGFLVLWFQLGWGAKLLPQFVGMSQGLNSIVILLLFCALFGLSMDYQVFLISRMAEEWHHSRNNKLAVRHGIELTGRVVTGAAAIMISIFLSFAFVSVMETRQFGTGMAAAILFDATVIRLLVFPSAMLLVGKANWWWPFGRKKTMQGENPMTKTQSIRIKPPTVLAERPLNSPKE